MGESELSEIAENSFIPPSSSSILIPIPPTSPNGDIGAMWSASGGPVDARLLADPDVASFLAGMVITPVPMALAVTPSGEVTWSQVPSQVELEPMSSLNSSNPNSVVNRISAGGFIDQNPMLTDTLAGVRNSENALIPLETGPVVPLSDGEEHYEGISQRTGVVRQVESDVPPLLWAKGPEGFFPTIGRCAWGHRIIFLCRR